MLSDFLPRPQSQYSSVIKTVLPQRRVGEVIDRYGAMSKLSNAHVLSVQRANAMSAYSGKTT